MRSSPRSPRRSPLARSLVIGIVLGACSSGQSSRDAGLSIDGRVDRDLVDADTTRSPTDGDVDRTSDHPSNCVPSGPEICDGKDNDCNGVVDDGFSWQGMPVGSHCYPGVGACLATGTVVCANPSSATCSVMAGSPDDTFHSAAAPNGSWDWNCNNNVDRQYPLSSCDSFTAATCPQEGWTPVTGQAGDCGQMLVQTSCSTTASGCASTGAGQMVTERCK
jgi:hypothetical protein